MSVPDLPRAADLPPWMQDLRDRYLQTDTGQFILHGNVHDLVLCAGQTWHMSTFLNAFFEPSNKLVVHYDPGRGIWFETEDDSANAARIWVEKHFIEQSKVAPHGFESTPTRLVAENLARELGTERTSEIVLEALEVLLTAPDVPVAVIIHYAELVAPDGPAATLSFHDRTASARLHRWSISERVMAGDNLVILVTGALPDLPDG